MAASAIASSVSESSSKQVPKQPSKQDQANKAEIIRELAQLNIRMKNLEKEKTSQLYNRRSAHREMFVSLEEADEKFTGARKTERIKLHQQVNKVKNMVLRFRRELDDIKPTPEFVERLKVIMEEIEQNISQFKEQQRLKYDELLHEEKTLTQEITALESRIEAWNQITGGGDTARGQPTQLKSARDVNKCLPPEVAAFDKFLQQTGGVRGGWDEYDHGTFLKVRAKHKGKAVFLREAVSLIPTKTSEQIDEHEQWYQEYLRMQDVKKEAIRRWKEEKEAEKDDKLTRVEKEQVTEQQLSKRREEERLRQMEAERQQQIAKLGSWKAEREHQKKFEEAKKQREEKKKAAEEEAKRKKQLELRVQVHEFKQKRLEEEEARVAQQMALQQAEDEQRRRELAEKAEIIKDRTQQMLDAKKAKQDAKARPELEKQARLERFKAQVHVEVSNDPNRLLKPTAGWIERQRQSDQTNPGRVYQMPHRAVPAWRQNMH